MKKRLILLLMITFIPAIGAKSYGCGVDPVALLDVDPIYAIPEIDVLLDGHRSYDPYYPIGKIVTYSWDFGDGQSYVETEFIKPDGTFDGKTTHKYSSTGVKYVILTVVDNDVPARTSTMMHPVYVNNVRNVTIDAGYSTIQAAIDAASNGNVIEASKRTYTERIDFKGKNITVRSINPTSWDVIEDTIINGNDTTKTVVTFSTAQTNGAILSGFTITGGALGVDCNDGSPNVKNCIIENNGN